MSQVEQGPVARGTVIEPGAQAARLGLSTPVQRCNARTVVWRSIPKVGFASALGNAPGACLAGRLFTDRLRHDAVAGCQGPSRCAGKPYVLRQQRRVIRGHRDASPRAPRIGDDARGLCLAPWVEAAQVAFPDDFRCGRAARGGALLRLQRPVGSADALSNRPSPARRASSPTHAVRGRPPPGRCPRRSRCRRRRSGYCRVPA